MHAVRRGVLRSALLANLRNLGRREKIEVIIDSMLTRLEKDGFIRTKKGKDGETELIPIKDLTNGF